MQFWNVYFLIKMGLHFTGKLTLQPWLNIGLFLLALGAHTFQSKHPKTQRCLAFLVLSPLALALLLHELGLVVSIELLNQIVLLLGFSAEYLLELIGRTVPANTLWACLAAVLLVRVLDRYLRTTSWVGSALLLVCIGLLMPHPTPSNDQLAQQKQSANQLDMRTGELAAERLALDPAQFQRLKAARNLNDKASLKPDAKAEQSPERILTEFFKTQSQLALAPFESASPKPDFDLIFLHICSMAWADLAYAKQSNHPLLTEADFLFSNFNSAASYSGPATIRLLRGACGQQDHSSLYQPGQAQCLMFKRLQQLGFDIQMGLNHDGAFQGFKNEIIKNLGVPASQNVQFNDVSVGALAFDGSKIGRDGDYLRTWWAQREQDNKQAVAYYYNSITLHDGNKLPNRDINSLQSYPIRLEGLLDDIHGLVEKIKRSGRKAMLVVVPEHGAGLSGEYGQLIGLRELPTPAVTKVPVFGYWIDPNAQRNPQYKYPIAVKQPMSYYGLNEFIARWLALPANTRRNPTWPLLIANLPATNYVAQQANITVMENKNIYLVKTPGNDWKPLNNPRKP